MIPVSTSNFLPVSVQAFLLVADEIEKELNGALIRAERLRGAVLKSAFEGKLV